MGGGGLAHRPRSRQDAVLHPISPMQPGSGCGAPDRVHALSTMSPGVSATPAASTEAATNAALGARIEQARALAHQVHEAVNAVRASGRCDVEGVLQATRQADAAFRMVQAVCNEMLATYAQMERTRA